MRGLEVGISKMFGNFELVLFLRGGMVQPGIFCTSRVCRFDFFFDTKDMLVILINRFIKSIAGRIEQNNNMFFHEGSEVFGKNRFVFWWQTYTPNGRPYFRSADPGSTQDVFVANEGLALGSLCSPEKNDNTVRLLV